MRSCASPGPGNYTVVARPTRSSAPGPWSPPVRGRSSARRSTCSAGCGSSTPAGRATPCGSSCASRASAAGSRSRIARRGARNRYGKFRSLGSAKVSSRSEVSKRFKLIRAGTYRLRFSYRGSATILGGRVTFPIRVTRRVTFG
jgi:hypothetical protein